MLESRRPLPTLVHPLALGILLHAGSASAQVGSPTRSDSIDLLHTRLELDLRQTGAGRIAGAAAVTFVPKVPGISVLPLDLLQLTVDSVVIDGTPRAFTHQAEVVSVQLGAALGPDDTTTVQVYYGGMPVTDASGFGGFYTGAPYQYDLGVAFDAVPHSFGRSWFPCFDNFVERCTFEFIVRTNGQRTVTANGMLLTTVDHGGGERTTHWSLEQPIPSYLASVAAGNYATVHDAYTSVSGEEVPVTLSAQPGDTVAMKASFIHLHDAFDGFEQDFGPYRWPRVGYTLTTQGAMEHATNICYPRSIADGTLTYERIMAHELAHHWFGNLITCSRAEEMWINEGMADLCGYMFSEKLYGRAAYMDLIRTEHTRLVTRLQLIDGGSYALSEVPQAITYGEHSYKKGAIVGHTLRSYLGDDLFRAGFTRVMTNNAYRDISSAQLRDSLMVATGVDLVDFFADWVFQPGWAAFEVDSFTTVPSGSGMFDVTVHVEQKLRFAEHHYNNVPVSVTFEGSDGQRWSPPTTVPLSGAQSTFQRTVPFAPRQVFLNDTLALALATTMVQDTVTTTGTRNLTRVDLMFFHTAVPAPMALRTEAFWVAADPAEGAQPWVQVSPDRWWRITGEQPLGLNTNVRFTFDGQSTGPLAYDQGMVQLIGAGSFQESALRILYRPDAAHPWSIWSATTLQSIGSTTDGFARLELTGLVPGDYTFGMLLGGVGLEEAPVIDNGWSLHPNPVADRLRYKAPLAAVGQLFILRDAAGRTVHQERVQRGEGVVQLPPSAAGMLFVGTVDKAGRETFVGRVLVVR